MFEHNPYYGLEINKQTTHTARPSPCISVFSELWFYKHITLSIFWYIKLSELHPLLILSFLSLWISIKQNWKNSAQTLESGWGWGVQQDSFSGYLISKWSNWEDSCMGLEQAPASILMIYCSTFLLRIHNWMCQFRWGS